MKTPLPSGEDRLPALLARGWGVEVASRPLFIPIGDSAYSYRVEAVTGEHYYLKVVDRRTAVARQMAARMRKFSLPLQRHVAELELEEMGAPLPQLTRWGSLAQEYGRLFLALYSFIEGETLSSRYPMSASLVRRIGRALGRLHAAQVPEHVRHNTVADNHLIAFDELGRAAQPVISLPHLSADSLQALARLGQDYKRHYCEAGGDASRYELPLVFYTCVAPTREEAQREGREALLRYIVHQHHGVDINHARQSIHQLEEREQLWFGTPGDLMQLIEQHQASVDNRHFVFWLNFGGMQSASVERSMQLLAGEVMPHFK